MSYTIRPLGASTRDAFAELVGRLVEALTEVTAGREAPGRFLFSVTAELFEQYGFSRGRQAGKHAWIVSRQVTEGPHSCHLIAARRRAVT